MTRIADKAMAARDQFLADYVDMHGSNAATANDAWEELERTEKFARDLVEFAAKYWVLDDIQEGVAEDAIKQFDGDHYLAACIVDEEIEKLERAQ